MRLQVPGEIHGACGRSERGHSSMRMSRTAWAKSVACCSEGRDHGHLGKRAARSQTRERTAGSRRARRS
eukprot:886355-Lingulodinium_polyedra.AAC.1